MRLFYLSLLFLVQFIFGLPGCQNQNNEQAPKNKGKTSHTSLSHQQIEKKIDVLHDLLIILLESDSTLLPYYKNELKKKGLSSETAQDQNIEVLMKGCKAERRELKTRVKLMSDTINTTNKAILQYTNYIKHKKESLESMLTILTCEMYRDNPEASISLMDIMETDLNNLLQVLENNDLKIQTKDFEAFKQKLNTHKEIHKTLNDAKNHLKINYRPELVENTLKKLQDLNTNNLNCKSTTLSKEIKSTIFLCKTFCEFNNETYIFLSNISDFSKKLVQSNIAKYKTKWKNILKKEGLNLEQSYPWLLDVINSKNKKHETKIPGELKICKCPKKTE